MQKLLVILLFSSFPLLAEILPCNHIEEILPHVKYKSLVIFDLDNTLIRPAQVLGANEWGEYKIQQFKNEGLPTEAATKKMLQAWLKIITQTSVITLEPSTVKVFQEIQKKGNRMMGLTIRHWDLSLWTLEQLDSVHISFQPNALNEKTLLFNKLLLRDGILFTTGAPKGESLMAFFKEVSQSPEHVVMIDDSLKHLQSVEKVLQEKKIPFIGLHYQFPEKFVKQFSPILANIEEKHMGKILSDAEAKVYLEKSLLSK
jgi:hypothetical protein